jgi:hypothetical protein
VKTVLLIAPLFIFSALMFRIMRTVPMWQDEYVFYRITSQLPNLATTSEWFFKDNPKTLVPSTSMPVDRKELFRLIYDTPIYTHSPLANYLVSPVVKTVNLLADNGIIPYVEEGSDLNKAETITMILRGIPIGLFAGTMYLIFKIMQHTVGDIAYLYSLPILASHGLLAGSYYFYWDAFMWFFFVLTLYLMEHNSKWAYLSACALVNTKFVIGTVLLIPLIIHNRKMIFTVLSILPFYFATVIVTGNPFYIVTHLIPQTSQYSWIYQYWTMDIVWNFGLIYYAVLTLPILLFVKKYPVYVATYLIVLLYAWGLGIAPDKMAGMFISGALVFPLIASEVYQRIKGYLPCY